MAYVITAIKQADDKDLINKVRIRKGNEEKEMAKDRAFIMRILTQKTALKALVNGEEVDVILTPFDKKGFIKFTSSEVQKDELPGVEKY
jgi:hypothetical protein